MPTDTLAVLGTYREKINAAIAQFFEDEPSLIDVELSEHSREGVAYLAEFSLRPGKRIRGSLAAMSYDVATGQDYSSVGIQLGISLELMQAYLLIVDDVMDKSATRRGEPTLQYIYRAEAEGHGGEHAANMLALNIGLLAQHFASLQLASLDVAPELLIPAFALMHRNISATGFGQLDDVYQQVGRTVTEADIIRKYTLKSSYYTFVNPLQLGFTLAGQGTPERLDACRKFGEAAGVAFQLHDDYLGIFGDTETLGKSNLDDIREGKFTLLMQHAFDHASDNDVALLRAILGKEDAAETELETVRRILTDCGAKDYTQRQTRDFAAQAKAELKDGALGDEALQQFLSDLVDYSTERLK